MESDPVCEPILNSRPNGSVFLRLLEERFNPFSTNTNSSASGDLQLLVIPTVMQTESMSAQSPSLTKLAVPPTILLSKSTATQLGVTDTDKLRIHLKTESLVLPVTIKASMADQIFCVFKTSSVYWQQTDQLNWFHLSGDQVEIVQEN